MTSAPRPRATYRLQLRAGVGFDEAAALADYLADLGVSHVYLSPVWQAAPGSTHGYDVVDHARLDDALGGPEGYARLCAALDRHGLGQVLDVVPNHMAIGPGNGWWWDVLENGPASLHAASFDVDWDPPDSPVAQSVLLPVLGDHYGRVLDAGDLRLARRGASFVVRYGEQEYPVSPRTLDTVLRRAAEALAPVPDLVPGAVAELAALAAAFGHLPVATRTDRRSVVERHRDKEVLRRWLGRLLDDHPDLADAVDAEIEAVNASPADLHALLERQNYRLAHWRVARHEMGYRRFFDITDLVAVRQEEPWVFEDSHELVLALVREGRVDGLRIDHPDGLADPAGYLARLTEATGGAWVVVEKILEPGERLRPSWPVAGTTGYDFLNDVGGVFVDPAGEAALAEAYGEVTGRTESWPDTAYRAALDVLRTVLAADVERLTALFSAACQRHFRHRDHTRPELRDALREVLAAFPAYRTYVRAADGRVDEEDRHLVDEAVGVARARRPDLDADLLAFLRSILLLEVRGPVEDELAMRFQQVSAPARAKGVEDTAFYRWTLLSSLNEVGGDPGRFGVGVDELHRRNAEALARHPLGLLALSTHDTKRSADVRARLALLSEIPEEWAAAVRRWAKLAGPHRTGEGEGALPDGEAEWLFYQSVVGAWPIDADRAWAYMQKAVREAKVHTSWTDPVPEYDAALERFVRGTLGDPSFTDDVAAFAAGLVGPGRVNALAQVLVQLTAPGVPDLYQGSELWDLSLVDPDNRRPVDWDLRCRLLAETRDAPAAAVLARADEGAPKLRVVERALALRGERPDAFGPDGTYEPLSADGRAVGHLVAYVRGGEVAVLVPRLVLGLERQGGWGETTVALAPGRWRNVLDGAVHEGGATLRLADVLDPFPVALLAREDRA